MFELANVPASVFAVISLHLWGILIRSTIVVALAALACKLLHRQSAAVRHRVWVFGLVAALVVPVISLLLPQFTLHVLPSTMDASRPATTQDLRPPSPASTAGSSRPAPTGGVTANSITPQPEPDAPMSTAISADAPKTVGRSEELPRAIAGSSGIGPMLLLCWRIGTLISSALFLISLARQSIRLGRLRRIDDDDWSNSVTTAAKTLGIQRPIVTLESDETCVPAVVGVLYPRLMVPCD